VPFLRAILKKLLNDINVGFIIKVEQFKKKIPREISSVSKYEKGEKYERHKIVFYVDKDTQTYKGQRVLPLVYYNNQQDIDNLQQAFNQLQSDLKELKEYE
jgi:hypothetical protein